MLELDGAHGSFVQEEVLVSGRQEQDTFGVQAAALQKGGMDVQGMVQKVQGGHTGNPTLLSWLSLVVVDWRKACQEEGWLSNVREGGRREGGKEA